MRMPVPRFIASAALVIVAMVPDRLAAQGTSAAASLDSLLATRISAASKYAQRSAEAPASVTIVTSEEIERYGFRNLQDVLESVRGFYVSNDRAYPYFGTRGFSRPTDYNNRILVLIDGHTLNEDVWGGADFGGELPINLDAVDRVEIVRGPGSVLYGTSAMFAVVNVVTKTGTAIEGIKVNASVASRGYRQAAIAAGRSLGASGSISFSGIASHLDGTDVYYPEFDAAATNNGVAHGLDWANIAGGIGGVSVGAFTARVGYHRRAKGIPTASFDVLFNTPGAQNVDEALWADARWRREFGAALHFTLRGYADQYRYRGVYPITPTANDEDGADSRVLGGEAVLIWDARSSTRLTFGTELRHVGRARYFENDFDGVMTSDNAPFDVASLFAQADIQLSSRLAFVGGVRYDRRSSTRDALSPRAAIVATPDAKTTAKLLYGEAFRAPSPAEADLETSSYSRNPLVKPERIATVELNVERRVRAPLLAGVTLYHYRLRNLIDQIDLDQGDARIEFRNVSASRAKGLELQLDYLPEGQFSARTTYAWQRAEADPTGERLTNSPAHIGTASVLWRAPNGLRSALMVRHEAGRRTLEGTTTPAFLRTDLTVGYAVRQGSALSRARFERISLRASNAFDQRYFSPGGVEHRQAQIAQDGRTLALHVDWRF